MPLPKLLCIVGPTASGKSALAERLAKEFDGEILAADSRVVYRGMDIGTAKVLSESESNSDRQHAGAVMRHGIAYWLQDLVDPDEPFTVVDWKREALAAIAEVLSRGRLPIFVGGTGLYGRALIDDLEPPAVPPDPELRAALEVRPLAELVADLEMRDPVAASRVDRKNPRRVLRALEIAIVSGAPVAAQRRKGRQSFDTLQIGIDLPRAELYRRIDSRVDAQVAAGLFEEVAGLIKKYGPDQPALSAIGYRQVVEHLLGKRTKEAAIERIKLDTHAYARRQLTWFRRDKRIRWVKTPEEAGMLVKKFLEG